ncbi:hypothetical protein GUJ93_ZPchr0003g17065 [Zizania palustris]|uniref:Uncharacterized protein n=1 Tax=Zizania palustris TaxID=103762 RepID=A0A8J5RZA4_ZIZPA|nr:hypothetical protein GUJ93_ZPchr0003g17065 [Zizania palustris]
MDHCLPAGLPVVRVGRRLQLASTFSTPGGRRRGSAGPPPALMADVRVVVRRHFPVGPKGVIIEKVADDIALRRQPSRKLRRPELVERALAEHVLPFIGHPIDRSAVAIAIKEISAYVSKACADPRLATGGVQVLVLLDTFAFPTLLRPSPRKQSRDDSLEFGVAMRTCPCKENAPATKKPSLSCWCMEFGAGSRKASSVGTIGDGRRKQVVGEEDQKLELGWSLW